MEKLSDGGQPEIKGRKGGPKGKCLNYNLACVIMCSPAILLCSRMFKCII